MECTFLIPCFHKAACSCGTQGPLVSWYAHTAVRWLLLTPLTHCPSICNHTVIGIQTGCWDPHSNCRQRANSVSQYAGSLEHWVTVSCLICLCLSNTCSKEAPAAHSYDSPDKKIVTSLHFCPSQSNQAELIWLVSWTMHLLFWIL